MKKPIHERKTKPGLEDSQLPDQIPESIGPYRIEQYMGRGGMSELYLGIHPDTKEPLTIKVLPQVKPKNRQLKERFRNEYKILSRLRHPHIVKVFAFGKWESGLYIAMEYLTGLTLKTHILKNTLSLDKALRVIQKVGAALGHLHGLGIVHRDVKPENIFLTDSGGVKLLDFGIAHMVGEGQEEELVGTPLYMAPELGKDPSATSARADIYSLGLVSYELIISRLCHGSVHISLLPKGLQETVSKALKGDPKDRYGSCQEYLDALRAYRESSDLPKDMSTSFSSAQLADRLQEAQNRLLPKAPSNWEHVSIGLVNHRPIHMAGVYADFFRLSDASYGIVVVQAPTSTVDGMLYLAVVRGLMRALAPLTESIPTLMNMMDDLLQKDPMNVTFPTAYLVLDARENSLHYLGLGIDTLWHVPVYKGSVDILRSENCPLGDGKTGDFLPKTVPWATGDLIILAALAPTEKEKLSRALQDERYQPPQKLVEKLLMRLHPPGDTSHAACVIAIERRQ